MRAPADKLKEECGRGFAFLRQGQLDAARRMCRKHGGPKLKALVGSCMRVLGTPSFHDQPKEGLDWVAHMHYAACVLLAVNGAQGEAGLQLLATVGA
jgi:hypothetical protein